MKLLILVLIICCVFPSFGILLGNRLIALTPILEAFMPYLIAIAGLYIIVKSVLK